MKFKILLFMFFLSSHAFGKSFTVCMEPKGVFPLYQEKGKKGKLPGLYLEMLKFMEKKLNLRTKIKRRPFKRCLSSLKAGRVDAVASASYKEFRKEFGVYPFFRGKLHSRWRISASSYYLYSRKRAPKVWDGKKFKRFNGSIAAVRGYSIVSDLKDLKVSTREVNKIEQAFQMVSKNRVFGVAAHENDGHRLMKKHNLKQSKIPLAKKDYFLLLSHQFVKRDKNFAEKVWKTVAEIRESKSFQKVKDGYLMKGKW